MAFSGLLALLDDVASIADDVATLTISATKKTTGLVTDDMAVTAEQALGIQRERELPVVGKVFLGSLFNKGVILVPIALLLNAFAPGLLTPLLMAGGTFLCFEGVEKIAHKFLHPKDHVEKHGSPEPEEQLTPEQLEKQRVWGAIRTDLILSAEIIAISLNEVADATLGLQIGALYAIAVVMTVGVYGAVALLVKLDDIGEAIVQSGKGMGVGKAILVGTPWLLKGIAWIGTVAMLLVGGSILLHGVEGYVPAIEHFIHDTLHDLHISGWGEWATLTLLDALIGIVVGAIIVGAAMGFKAVFGAKKGAAAH